MIIINILVAIIGVFKFDEWKNNDGNDQNNNSTACDIMRNETDLIKYTYVFIKMINAGVWFASLKLLIY